MLMQSCDKLRDFLEVPQLYTAFLGGVGGCFEISCKTRPVTEGYT